MIPLWTLHYLHNLSIRSLQAITSSINLLLIKILLLLNEPSHGLPEITRQPITEINVEHVGGVEVLEGQGEGAVLVGTVGQVEGL